MRWVDPIMHRYPRNRLAFALNRQARLGSGKGVSVPLRPSSNDCSAYYYGEQWLRPTGVPSTEFIPSPVVIPFLAGQSVVGIGAGWGHSAFVTPRGVAVLTGRPHDFRNVMRHISARSLAPSVQRFVDGLSMRLFPNDMNPVEHAAPVGDSFVAVRCGPASLTAFVTASGQLYMTGQNFYGQGGVGSVEENVLYTPQLVQGFKEGERVVDVALGTEHALAVTTSGALYAWGRGDRGQCGHGDMDSYTRAIRVLGPREDFLDLPVVAVSVGPATSACVTADGRLWVWGKMRSLQQKQERGDGWIMADQTVPRLVQWADNDGALTGSVGRTHTAENEAGAGAPSDAASSSPTMATPALPVLIPESRAGDGHAPADLRVVALSSGQAHMCFITADGRLWLIGMRGRGVLYDDSVDVVARLAMPSPPPSLIALFPEATWEGQAVVASAGDSKNDTPSAIRNSPPAASSTAPLDAVPEVYMQTEPFLVAPGPLAGKRVVALRSSIHHSYAVTACGGVYRLGWRGCVLAMPEFSGLVVRDVAFGFLHALALVSPGPIEPGTGAASS